MVREEECQVLKRDQIQIALRDIGEIEECKIDDLGYTFTSQQLLA